MRGFAGGKGGNSDAWARLDEIDREILLLLRRHGRMSNKDLANAVGLSASACLERKRKLQRIGAIFGYRAELAANVLGERFDVSATIQILDLPEAAQAGIEGVIRSSGHINDASLMSGAFDCMISFSSEDPKAWPAFCAQLFAAGLPRDRLKFAARVARLEPTVQKPKQVLAIVS
jgi:DNA-binding Lrp family transcriptional regulator